ncbi:MAG: SDR family oxidoreductase [Pseudomonas sp.]|uniref:SDR family NAD(P)-dependent oxidoreductase n=1 Tax=Pseudomonas sp. TaxID=306 RepID=UPI003981DC83
MDLGLRDRVVLVVGAGSGIGAATAEVLAAEGAHLVLMGRREAALQETAARLPASGAPPLLVALDASVEGAMEEAVARTLDRFGALHSLAVIAGPMGPRGSLHEMDPSAWQHYFDSGLMIAVRACKAALVPMRAQGVGSIVTTSAYSIRAQKPALIAYTAAKAAIASITKNIAKTYGPEGIRANCIAPGVVEKDAATRAVLAERYGVPEARARYEYVRREFQMAVALERVGQHREFADVIAFLLSERASYVTGATINIDGGSDF